MGWHTKDDLVVNVHRIAIAFGDISCEHGFLTLQGYLEWGLHRIYSCGVKGIRVEGDKSARICIRKWASGPLSMPHPSDETDPVTVSWPATGVPTAVCARSSITVGDWSGGPPNATGAEHEAARRKPWPEL